MKDTNIIHRLNQKIQENGTHVESEDVRKQKESALLQDTVDTIKGLNTELKQARAQLNAQNLETSKILSTTQFFNPSLAKDFYNMNGNSLQTNSYMAVRKMVGIANNTTPGVQQQISNLSVNADGTINPNGTAVGLTNGSQVNDYVGWWFWTHILVRIEYFANMFEIKCSDKKLKRAVERYLTDVVLSGYAVIEKVGDTYRNWCCNNVRLNEDGNLKSFDAYNSAFVINEIQHDNKDQDVGLHKNFRPDAFVWGMWRSNGYNVWYYLVEYLMHTADLLYVFWNNARFNKTLVVQKKGNDATASLEANQILDPTQPMVSVNTVGILDNDDNTDIDGHSIKLENYYAVEHLGDGEQAQYSVSNLLLWNDYWDNLVGIRSMPLNTNTNRAIANEINPLTIKISKIQQDFKRCLQNMCDQIEEAGWGHVEFDLLDDLLLQSLNPNEASKNEGGNETEQKFNNGEDNVPNNK